MELSGSESAQRAAGPHPPSSGSETLECAKAQVPALPASEGVLHGVVVPAMVVPNFPIVAFPRKEREERS